MRDDNLDLVVAQLQGRLALQSDDMLKFKDGLLFVQSSGYLGCLRDMLMNWKNFAPFDDMFDFKKISMLCGSEEVDILSTWICYKESCSSRAAFGTSMLGYISALMLGSKVGKFVDVSCNTTTIDDPLGNGGLIISNLLNVQCDLESMLDKNLVVYDVSKESYILRKFFKLSGKIFDDATVSNVRIRGVRLRDFRASIKLGMLLPATNIERELASNILQDDNSVEIPLFITSFEKSPKGIIMGQRELVKLDMSSLTSMCFDYYGLTSKVDRLEEYMRNWNFIQPDDWEVYRLNMVSGKHFFKRGETIVFNSGWFQGRYNLAFLCGLARSKLYYVGQLNGVWDWVAVYDGGDPLMKPDRVASLLNRVPKWVQLCVLYGAKAKPHEGNFESVFVKVVSQYCRYDHMTLAYAMVKHLFENVRVPLKVDVKESVIFASDISIWADDEDFVKSFFKGSEPDEQIEDVVVVIPELPDEARLDLNITLRDKIQLDHVELRINALNSNYRSCDLDNHVLAPVFIRSVFSVKLNQDVGDFSIVTMLKLRKVSWGTTDFNMFQMFLTFFCKTNMRYLLKVGLIRVYLSKCMLHFFYNDGLEVRIQHKLHVIDDSILVLLWDIDMGYVFDYSNDTLVDFDSVSGSFFNTLYIDNVMGYDIYDLMLLFGGALRYPVLYDGKVKFRYKN